MRNWRIFYFLSVFFTALCTATPTHAVEESSSAPIGSQLLVDISSGQTIVSTNEETVFSSQPSDVVLKLYAALEYLQENNHKLQEKIITKVLLKKKKTSYENSIEEYLCAYVLSQKEVFLDEILKGLKINSAEFNDYLRQKLSDLSLKNTHMDEQGTIKTNLVDLSIAASALYEKHPVVRTWARMESIKLNPGKLIVNSNLLLSQSNAVNGIAYGQVNQSRIGLIIYENEKNSKNMRRLFAAAVVDEEDNLEDAIMNLINIGYRQYETVLLYSRGDEAANIRVYQGARDKLNLIVPRDISITLPKNDVLSGSYKRHLSASIIYDKNIRAPIAKDSEIGTLLIKYNGEIIAKSVLVAGDDVEVSGLFRKLLDNIGRAVEK